MKYQYQKGDIILANLGKPPQEIKGHEQAYMRPCIVVKAFNNLKLAIIIPCSTKQQKYSIFTIVKLPKETSGLTSDSYALCHQIRTISFDRIVNKLGKLNNTDIFKIHAVLIDTLEL